MNWITCVIYVILMTGWCFGINNNGINNKSSKHTDMKTLVKTAVSNNKPVVELLGDAGAANITNTLTNSSVKSLTISSLGTPSIGWNKFLQDISNSESVHVGHIAKQTVNNRTAEQTVNNRTAEQTVNNRTAEQTVNNRTAEQTVNNRTAEQTVNNLTAEQTVNNRTAEQTVNNRTAEQTVNNRTAEQTVNNLTAEQTVNNLTSKLISTKRNQQSITNDTNAENRNSIQKKSNENVQGIYIPMEILSRTRRQVPDRSQNLSSLRNRRRVLFLLNPNRTHTALNRTMLLRPSLFLLRNNQSQSSNSNNHARLPNQQRHSQLNTGTSLNDASRQQAIQRIDLRNIDLSHDSQPNSFGNIGAFSNDTSNEGSALQGNTTEQQRSRSTPIDNSRRNSMNMSRRLNSRISNTGNTHGNRINSPDNNTPQRRFGDSNRNMRARPQNNNIRRSDTNSINNNNIQRQLLPAAQSRNTIQRVGTNSVSGNSRQRILTEPRLALQQPVRTSRIAFLLTPNITSRGQRGSFVRTVLPSTPLRVALANSNSLAVRNAARRGTRPGIQRGNVRRLSVGTQQRTARPQTHPSRRTTRPTDPFTRRFSAGFQRGSSLLNVPDTTETRGFDGTVQREPNRFDNNFLNPFVPRPGLGLPFGGGFGGPGGMFGPPLM